MDVTFLGTGAGMPAKSRNVTSIALHLLNKRGDIWLFDCGEATQHQILHTPIKPRKIHKIFITHLHGDHIFGLPGLIGSRSFLNGETTLSVYGPKGIKEYIEVSIKISQTHIKYPLEIIEIEEGVIFEDEDYKVEAFRLEHGIECFGFRIEEQPHSGALLIDKLQDLGIGPGPIYKQLKNKEIVTLEDGTQIKGTDFLAPDKPGRIIAIAGDTRMTDATFKLASNADLFIHEATFAAGDDVLAHEYFHTTTLQAAKIAKDANVKNLILTHISARYQGLKQLEMLLNEAKQLFENTIIAEDLLQFKLYRE